MFYNLRMNLSENKWTRGAIPALLLHCSIGTVYCWSIFSQEIASYIGFSKGAVEWAFSFAIFFLGMSAAFLGNIVEKDIHKSSLIATICFAAGLAGTAFFIQYGGAHKHSLVSLVGIYVCYGYNWCQIRDSPTRSFHSYGIALDILPRGWGNKIVYWGYEKQNGNADWMLIPLKDRWLPPPAVVKAFEDEGFIWGGRWAVWDNMHFEYHPELLLASKIYEKM